MSNLLYHIKQFWTLNHSKLSWTLNPSLYLIILLAKCLLPLVIISWISLILIYLSFKFWRTNIFPFYRILHLIVELNAKYLYHTWRLNHPSLYQSKCLKYFASLTAGLISKACLEHRLLFPYRYKIENAIAMYLGVWNSLTYNQSDVALYSIKSFIDRNIFSLYQRYKRYKCTSYFILFISIFIFI